MLVISASARDTTWSACMKAWLRLAMISLYRCTSSMLSSVSLSPTSLWSTWILLSSATWGSSVSILVRLPTSRLDFRLSTRSVKVMGIQGWSLRLLPQTLLVTSVWPGNQIHDICAATGKARFGDFFT